MRAISSRTAAACLVAAIVGVVGPAVRARAPQGPAGPPPAPSPAGPHRVPRTSDPIKVDGALDDPGWANALKLDLPFEFRPAENVEAPVRTECLLTYDDKFLYVGFKAFDPEPARIRAHISDRDSMFRDDFVGVILDTFGDDRRAFEFLANPLGVQADGTLNDVGNGEDFAWDAIWGSAGRITPEGYEVEMAIPFTSLRFPRSSDGRAWGFLATRSYPRTVRHQLSVIPIDRNRNCFVCQNVKINGFEGIEPGRNLDLIPTATANRTDERPSLTEPMVNGDYNTDLGLTARWGFTPGLGLIGALNPDFSQVEADAEQLSVNTRFALYYPEKRPLFLEGADYFETPYQAVYTRTIADPSWGTKVSGKQGRSALGVFVGHDTETNLLFPANQGSSSGFTGSGSDTLIARYRMDVGKASTIGALVTAREGEDYHNRVGGIDGLFRLNDTEKIVFQALASSTEYPDQVYRYDGDPGSAPPPLEGGTSLLSASYQHESRGWEGWATYSDLGRGFRADLGFIPRVDVRQVEAGAQKIWWGKPGATVNLLRLGGDYERVEDHTGLLTDESLEATFYMQLPYQSWLEGEGGRVKEHFAGTTFDKWVLHWFYNIRPTGDFTCSLGGNWGDQVAYDTDPPQLGRVLRLFPGLTYDRRHLRIQFDHTFEALDLPQGRLYRANLTQLRLAYHFTVRAFFRAILQYQALRSDPELYPDPASVPEQSRTLSSQLLFSYKVNPQTVIFAGYSEGRAGETGIAVTQTDRTVFVKLGYAWVM